MPRYIDADELKDNFCDACATLKRYGRTVEECRNKTDTYGNRCFKMRLIDKTPTADVVPKSEVESILDELIIEAGEIAESYKKEADGMSCSEFARIEYRGTQIGALLVQYKIAELKKKYTEGEDKPASEEKYFSPEDVRKMTNQEVREKYTAIRKSMERW